ncbi:MAG: Dabb family protein [Clostridia bacterium]|nr:Dabb family protein [Clostridia bacterium]
MIKHIVCFKLKDNTKESKEQAKEMIMSMVGKVPMLRGLEAGTDFLCSPRSYDVILQALLDDEKALEAYQSDPYHAGVVKKYLGEAAEASRALDYYI